MRIHSNATLDQIKAAVATVPTVQAVRLTEHRSGTHARAFELNLSGSGVANGQYGNSDTKSATWDEWGTVMGRIFDADPNTRMGGTTKRPVYRDAGDFDWQTDGRFSEPGLPADTHYRHTWVGHDPDSYDRTTSVMCKKCSAVKRWYWG